MKPSTLVVILCSLALGACHGSTSREPIEVKRVSSGSGLLDAVLFRYETSAIDDHPLILTVVPKGEKIPERTAAQPKEYSLAIAEGLLPNSLSWSTDDKILSIKYQAGQKIFSFKNYAYLELPRKGAPWQIEVVLERTLVVAP
jgi:hypothetical protein